MRNNLPQQRLYGLDAMRALLAILGIFLHAGVSHIVKFGHINIPWYGHSNESSIFFNWIICWIHSFRMPAFFFLSGFFSYLVYKKRNASGLALSRTKRIAIPFLIIWTAPVLFGYTLAFFIPEVHSFLSNHKILGTLKTVGPFWFIYYLLLIDILTLLVIYISKPLKGIKERLSRLQDNKTINRLSLAILLLAPMTLLVFSSYWFAPTKISINFCPELLLYYTCFFVLGWFTHTRFNYLVAFSKRYWAHLLIFALMLVTWQCFLIQNFNAVGGIFRIFAVVFFSIAGLSMVFSVLGLSLSIFEKRSRLIEYLAYSSYWIYISQTWIILYFEHALRPANVPLFDKYLATVFLSLLTCLLSYQLIIRNRKIFH